MTLLFLVFALGFIALMSFGLISAAERQGRKVDTLQRGVQSQGTIMALERDYQQWHYCYLVVRFRNTRGEWLTLRCRTSILRENLKVGQQVPIRYPAAAPEDFIVVSGLDFLL